MKYMCSALYV